MKHTTFAGDAFRSVPENGPFDPGALVSRDGENDRWNRPGEPTLYLALDPGVAIAEAGRHLDVRPGPGRSCQRIVRLTVRADRLVDLRDADAAAAVGIRVRLEILDRERAREVAGRLRETGAYGGILVPSAAFLDDPDRGNLVLFMETFDGVGSVIEDWDQIGRLELTSG